MGTKVDTRSIVRCLRYLPKSEVDSYCVGCGMTERERYALLDYIYNLVTQEDLCMRLGMSRSTFIRHEKVLAVKLLRYMVSVGAIDEIVDGRKSVDGLVSDLVLFGK